MEARKPEIDSKKPEPFDLSTHIRDPKTGRVIKFQPYTMRCEKGRPTIFERNGIEYYGTGELVHPVKEQKTK